jgi:hypothetical protein
MLAYFVVLPTSIFLIQHHPHVWWRYPVALAPLTPLLFLLRTIVRFVRRMDELQRRIQLDALVFSFAGTALVPLPTGCWRTSDSPASRMATSGRS